MYSMDINEIFENVRKDTSLLANIDIDELLRVTENDKNDYLNNKTLDDVLDENIKAIKKLKLPKGETTELCDKLVGYRLVDKIFDIHKGKHIRWIRTGRKITNGAIVVDVKFMDNGTHILCRNPQGRMFQINFNECLVFQKLSVGEQLILMAYEQMRS
jgi:hypothetical protein